MPSITTPPIMDRVRFEQLNRGVSFASQSYTYERYISTMFSDCDFTEADLTAAIFQNCTFERCFFTNSNLSHTLFASCTFQESSFNGAMWNFTRMFGCPVNGTSGHKVLLSGDLQSCYFEGVEFNHVLFSNIHLVNTLLQQVAFNNCTIDGATISGIEGVWTRVTLQRSTMSDVLFSQTNLRGVEMLAGCKTRKVVTKNCYVENCSFVVVKTRKCSGCGKPTRETDFYKADVCKTCAEAKGYSLKNSTYVGKQTKYPAFSIEVEVDDVDIDSDPDPILLIKHGFIACSDTSVQVEYKSPIFLDMKAFSHVLPVLQSVRKHIGDHCGTHVHVQMISKEYLNSHYEQVFYPLYKHCYDRPAETSKFWGRFFNSYATQGSASSRYSWINISSYSQPTIEFRLCKFKDEVQFRAMLVFCRSIVRYLDAQVPKIHTSGEWEALGMMVLNLYKNAVKNTKENN